MHFTSPVLHAVACTLLSPTTSQDAADTASMATFMTEEVSEAASVLSLEQHSEGINEMTLRKTQVRTIVCSAFIHTPKDLQ